MFSNVANSDPKPRTGSKVSDNKARGRGAPKRKMPHAWREA